MSVRSSNCLVGHSGFITSHHTTSHCSSIAIIAMVDDQHATGANHKLVERQVNSNTGDLLWSSSSNALSLGYINNETTTISEAKRNLKVADQTLPITTTTASTSKQHLAGEQTSLATNIFLTTKKSFNTPLISQEKFHWDQTEQGHILGAFFYGYILFQIPGARMAESVGAKWIIMAASAGSAVISLAFPLSTQLNSIHLLMVLRFVMGLCQSAFFPAAYVIFCRWLPERERSVLLPIMFIGSNMGSISTYILSSYLISSAYGWPSVFYLSGLICSIVSLFWCIFGSNGPEDNRFITDKERYYIESNVNNQSSESSSLNGFNSGDLSESGVDKEIELIRGNRQQQLDDLNNNNELGLLNKNVTNNRQRTLKSVTSLPIIQSNTILDNNNNNNNRDLVNNRDSGGAIEVSVASQTNTSIIAHNAPSRHPQRTSTPVPSWSKLLKSLPVWTLILSMYGNEWSNVVLCFELPTYLNTALGFPIEQNGVINSFFQFSYAVTSPIVSSLGAYMLDKHLWGMRKIHVRKLFQSLATFGQLACFVSVPICGANRGLIIMFMFLAIVFKACANAGDIMISGDLSPGKY